MKPDFRSFAKRLMAILPALIIMVIANVFIIFSAAAVVLLELMQTNCNKYVALAAALATSCAVYIYINYNHKLKDYINENNI